MVENLIIDLENEIEQKRNYINDETSQEDCDVLIAEIDTLKYVVGRLKELNIWA